MKFTQAPFSTRSDFDRNTVWGTLTSTTMRFDLEIAQNPNNERPNPESLGAIHSERASLLLGIGGGHLRAPKEELLASLEQRATHYLSDLSRHPFEYIRQVVAWLEEEQSSGFLERSYTTASLLVLVSDNEVWTWSFSPHGIIHGFPNHIEVLSTDLRLPVLRRLGLVEEPTFLLAERAAHDQCSSIFCIGTQHGYEELRSTIGAGQLVGIMTRGVLPFSSEGTRGASLNHLWSMDAGWHHGLKGRAVVAGQIKQEELSPPLGWRVHQV